MPRYVIHSRSRSSPSNQKQNPGIPKGAPGFGTADGIRTHDLQSRSLALYPAELQPHIYRTRSFCYNALVQMPEYYSKRFLKSK